MRWLSASILSLLSLSHFQLVHFSRSIRASTWNNASSNSAGPRGLKDNIAKIAINFRPALCRNKYGRSLMCWFCAWIASKEVNLASNIKIASTIQFVIWSLTPTYFSLILKARFMTSLLLYVTRVLICNQAHSTPFLEYATAGTSMRTAKWLLWMAKTR